MAIGRVPGATGIQPSIVDAKGDIIAATAADSVSRLAVGTNNQVLTADSAEATGLKYANGSRATLTTTGDILYASAANTPARLAIGSTDQVLKVSGGIPAWGAAPAASFVGCFGYLQTTMTLSNNTDTFVTWDSETIDTDGFHSTTTNTDRFTVPAGKAGKYLFSGTVQFQGNATGSRTIAVAKNGATAGSRLAYFEEAPGNGTQINLNWFLIVNAAVADYFGVYVNQTSGGNLSLFGNASNTMASTFAFVYLGA